MNSLRILHLSDDRPGHYHLADGVIAAISRRRAVDEQKVVIARRWMIPGRTLRTLCASRAVSPAHLLRIGYGLDPATLQPADLVISSGGETLPPNVAAARLLGTENIFIGSRRGVDSENFSLIVSSYDRHQGQDRHLVTLKPSALDPDALGRPNRVPTFTPDRLPKICGLLVGGDSGLFKYTAQEWSELFDFARAVSRAWGTRWLVSTSRRTPPEIAEAAFELAKDKDTVLDFVDYRFAGPGTLEKIFSRADAILCSEDSSTMISESIWARLPVVGVSPNRHSFKAEEADYRAMMLANDWCRFLPIAGLTPERFGEALSQIKPLRENPLDTLAGDLKARLPALF
ncbi:MAG: mitochondrial fission ELM1 family protein [Hyphomicrobiaceae bacterium]|nr:mitochondrial fission ELM1 family protein [Hyphomicrobiaceae bacterium]